MVDSDSGSDPLAQARVLAMMVAANGRIDPRELQVLETLGAYAHVGVSRERFAALAAECVRDVGGGLAECSWLRARDQAYVERLLDAVADPGERLALCRLAAAVLTADGLVSEDERLIYQHALVHWQISHTAVAQANLPRVERSG